MWLTEKTNVFYATLLDLMAVPPAKLSLILTIHKLDVCLLLITLVIQIFKNFSLITTFFIGDTILAVNGPDGIHPSQGLALDLALEQLVNIWSPKDDTFKEPHDVAVSPNGKHIYVVDIGSEAKKKIYKFSIQL